MSYVKSQLPQDAAVSLFAGLLGGLLGGFLTCIEVTREAVKAYPHDGQDGLAGFIFGVYALVPFAVVSTAITLFVRIRKYKNAAQRKEEQDFEVSLLEARSNNLPLH